MKSYKDIDGDSGVVAYEYGADFIRVQFSTGSIYLYTYKSAGHQNIETMKRLADSGNGLNAFINTTVRKNYERREL
jgi:hypothetical protein